MRKLFVVVMCTLVVGLLAPMAFGDDTDPYIAENPTLSCSAPGSPPWCGGYNNSYLDPLSGMHTLVYFFNTTKVPTVVAGDILLTEPGGSVGGVVRFEMLNADTPVAFFYSDDTNGGLPADVGLPSSYQAKTFTLAEGANGNTSVYTPTSTQPGYMARSTYTSDEFYSPADVPEPGSIFLLGTVLLVAGRAIRRRQQRV